MASFKTNYKQAKQINVSTLNLASMSFPESTNNIPNGVITLTHEFYPQKGGIATYTQEIAKASHENGLDIEVWAPSNNELKEGLFPYTVRQLPVAGTQNWPCRLRLAKYLYQNKKLWHGQTLYLPEPGPQRAWMYLQSIGHNRLGKLVITLHGSEIETFTQTLHRKLLFAKLLKKADRIGVVSTYSKKLLFEKFPELLAELIPKTVICHGALRTDIQEIEKRIEKPQKENIKLLTVGRIHPRKGQLEVVEALAALEPKLKKQCEYIITGSCKSKHSNYKKKILSIAQSEGVNVHFKGEVPDNELAELYATSDIFIMASTAFKKSIEGFGLVYLEASYHKLPVIAHDIGGVSDAVKHEHTGLKADPNDRNSLTQAIKNLVQDESIRLQLGENGHKWAKRFNWNTSANKLFHGLNS